MTFIHEAKRLVLALSHCLSLRLGRLSNESENLSYGCVKTSQLGESFPVLNIPDVVECVVT